MRSGRAASGRQREAACAHSASGQEHPLRGTELSRSRQDFIRAVSMPRQEVVPRCRYVHQWPNSVIGPVTLFPARTIHRSTTSRRVAVVIGAAGKHRSEGRIPSRLWLHTIVNDVSARTLQTAPAWFLGKSLDGYCPDGAVHSHGR